MDSFELNKIIGAFLGVVFVIFSVSILADSFFHSPPPETPGYAIVVPEDGAEDAAEEEEAVESVLPLLADADPAAGENVFKRCQACHTPDQGGPNKVGPNLWGVVGAAPASHEGFSYSAAMQEFAEGGTVWSYENLDQFLLDPKGKVPGTAMAFAGLRGIEDRANVIAYLRTLAEEPEPLPEPAAAEEAGEASAEADDAAAEGEDMVAQPAAGEDVFKRCQACHTADQGGPNKVGPNLWGVVGRPVASHEDFSYSAAMQEFAEGGTVWTSENLDQFLLDPKGKVPGTAMGFAGLKGDEDRANVIAYLRTLADEPAAAEEAGEESAETGEAAAAEGEDMESDEAQPAAEEEPAPTDQ